MRKLESHPWWAELVSYKDELSLRELAERFEVTPGAISAAFKRTGTKRKPAPPGPRSLRKNTTSDELELPPEPGEVKPRRRLVRSPQGGAITRRRGSKDHLLDALSDRLGNVPDSEIAKEAGVSIRTVASYRARHAIDGYSGPRRKAAVRKPRRSKIEPFRDQLGHAPDRVIAEKAGVSVNAVRNYRVKHGITSAGRGRPRMAPKSTTSSVKHPNHTQNAWKIVLQNGQGSFLNVVLAGGFDAAVSAANQLAQAQGAAVTGIELVGPVVTTPGR